MDSVTSGSKNGSSLPVLRGTLSGKILRWLGIVSFHFVLQHSKESQQNKVRKHMQLEGKYNLCCGLLRSVSTGRRKRFSSHLTWLEVVMRGALAELWKGCTMLWLRVAPGSGSADAASDAWATNLCEAASLGPRPLCCFGTPRMSILA